MLRNRAGLQWGDLPWVDVREFGWVDSPSSDNAPAILAAIAAAPIGGVVQIPLGSYVASPFVINKSITLQGAGKFSTKITASDTSGSHFVVISSDDVIVQNIGIDGNYSNQLSNSGTALIINGDASAGGGAETGRERVKIIDCEVWSAGFDAIGAFNAHNCEIRGNTIHNYYDSGIDLVEGCRGVIVSDNDIITSGRFGISLDCDTPIAWGRTHSNIVSRNRIKIIPGADVRDGILVFHSQSTIVDSNIVDMTSVSNKCGIRCWLNGVANTISNNTVFGSSALDGNFGIYIDPNHNYAEDGGDGAARDYIVSGNTTNNLAMGIYLYNVIGASIVGNSGRNNTRGFRAYADSATDPMRISVIGNQWEDLVAFEGNSNAAGASWAECYGNGVQNNWVINTGWTLFIDGAEPTFSYADVGTQIYLNKSIRGTAAPVATPRRVGLFFVDTNNGKLYVATGTASSADWTILN